MSSPSCRRGAARNVQPIRRDIVPFAEAMPCSDHERCDQQAKPTRLRLSPEYTYGCVSYGVMRTNIEIDDAVLHEAQELIGAATKREAVDVALRELVARHRRIGILDLRGRVRWEGSLEDSRRGRS